MDALATEYWFRMGERVDWRKLVGASGSNQVASSSKSGVSGVRPWIVLYVEDSRYLQEGMPWRMKRGFGAGTLMVEGCRDGMEALGKYTVEPGRYSCIVSDLVLPGLDGCGLIREVRSLERERGLRPIPAIALSAYEERMQECFDVGFNAFYIKGAKFDHVLLRIANTSVWV